MEFRIFFTIQYFLLRFSGSFGSFLPRGLRDIPPDTTQEPTVTEAVAVDNTTVKVRIYNAGKDMNDIEKRIVSELSWPTRLLLLKDYAHKHYPGMTDDENEEKNKEKGKEEEKEKDKEKEEEKDKEKAEEKVKEKEKEKEKDKGLPVDDTRLRLFKPSLFKIFRRNFKPREQKKILIVFVRP